MLLFWVKSVRSRTAEEEDKTTMTIDQDSETGLGHETRSHPVWSSSMREVQIPESPSITYNISTSTTSRKKFKTGSRQTKSRRSRERQQEPEDWSEGWSWSHDLARTFDHQHEADASMLHRRRRCHKWTDKSLFRKMFNGKTVVLDRETFATTAVTNIDDAEINSSKNNDS